MVFSWQARRGGPDEKDSPRLEEVAPIPSGPETDFTLFPSDWQTVLGAAALGYGNILARLLIAGHSPDQRDSAGRTPLIYAVAGDRRDAVRMLLNSEASLNAADQYGHTPLLVALVRGRRWAAGYLRESGARTGFAEAAAAGDLALASRLPTNTELDAPVLEGHTLLTYLADQGSLGLTRLLLERGASPNAPNAWGLLPLDAAANHSRGRIVRLLLDWGANPALAREMDAATLRRWAGLDESTEDSGEI